MGKKLVLCLLLTAVDCSPLAQRTRIKLPSSSYLAPLQEEPQAEASAPVTLYASPGAEPAPAPTRIISISSLPDLPPSQPASLYSSPSDLVRDFDYNEVNFLGDYDIERAYDTDTNFAASKIEVVETPASKDYGAPRAEILSSASEAVEAVNDYSVPRAEVISFKDNNDINEAAASVITTSVVKSSPATSKPIAILRSENTGVNDGRYRYSYETENGISQEVSGEMKMVNDNPVYVMRGSYSYIGPDAQTYTVDWYADETGYHPSAPHLPRSVQPNHPEVAAAVRSQLEFAAQEEEEAAAAAASNTNLVFAAPEESQFDDIYAVSDDLAGYGESLAGYN